jgi:hypothetical protein
VSEEMSIMMGVKVSGIVGARCLNSCGDGLVKLQAWSHSKSLCLTNQTLGVLIVDMHGALSVSNKMYSWSRSGFSPWRCALNKRLFSVYADRQSDEKTLCAFITPIVEFNSNEKLSLGRKYRDDAWIALHDMSRSELCWADMQAGERKFDLYGMKLWPQIFQVLLLCGATSTSGAHLKGSSIHLLQINKWSGPFSNFEFELVKLHMTAQIDTVEAILTCMDPVKHGLGATGCQVSECQFSET